MVNPSLAFSLPSAFTKPQQKFGACIPACLLPCHHTAGVGCLSVAYLVVHANSQVMWSKGQEGWLRGYGNAHLTALACYIHDCQLLEAGAVGQSAAPSAADHRNGCQVCVKLPGLHQQRQGMSQSRQRHRIVVSPNVAASVGDKLSKQMIHFAHYCSKAELLLDPQVMCLLHACFCLLCLLCYRFIHLLAKSGR